MTRVPGKAQCRVGRLPDGVAELRLGGAWTMDRPRPDWCGVAREIDAAGPPRRIRVVAESIEAWDEALLGFLLKAHRYGAACGIDVDLSALPDGVRRLAGLAMAVPERTDAGAAVAAGGLLARLGGQAIAAGESAADAVRFAGELAIAFGRLLAGRARFRPVDMGLMLQQCGPGALLIVSVISVLVGMIVAFMGAVQLQMFGAQIYIADMVAVGMTREMGALMTGVIMAGRTGTAFAAQIGTMQVNEEVDALRTLGLPPVEFLALPRVIALVVMMPLLCVYADVLGMLGGAAVAVGLLDLTASQYCSETIQALILKDLAAGVIKSVAFGVVVAFCGCRQGLRCGRNAEAVGEATTAAVVGAILGIVVLDSILSIVYTVTGF